MFYDFDSRLVRTALNVPHDWLLKVHRLTDGERVLRPVAGEHHSYNSYEPNALIVIKTKWRMEVHSNGVELVVMNRDRYDGAG